MKRIASFSNTNNSSLAYLAYKEQQIHKLDWYKRMEPLLRLDDAYTTDHVTLFKNKSRANKRTSSHDTPANTVSPRRETSLIFQNKVKFISSSQSVAPMISRQFTSHIIMKSLKTQYKVLWNSAKVSSPKLEFYHAHKSNFTKEIYLDCITNFYHRSSLTKLRISSHDLTIETGRYKQTSRDQRLCMWCKLSLGLNFVESEEHMLFNCDLYASIRQQHKNSIAHIFSHSTAETTTPASQPPNAAQYHESDIDEESLQIKEVSKFVHHALRDHEQFLRDYNKSRSKFQNARSTSGRILDMIQQE